MKIGKTNWCFFTPVRFAGLVTCLFSAPCHSFFNLLDGNLLKLPNQTSFFEVALTRADKIKKLEKKLSSLEEKKSKHDGWMVEKTELIRVRIKEKRVTDKHRLPPQYIEILGQHGSVLNDTLQVIKNQNDTWRQSIELYEKYIKHLTNDFDELEGVSFLDRSKTRRSLEELQVVEQAIARSLEQLSVLYASMKSLEKKGEAEQKKVQALNKELELKSKELVDLESEDDTKPVEGRIVESPVILKGRFDLYADQKKYIDEKIKLAQASVEKYKLNRDYSESLHQFESLRLRALEKRLSGIRNVLRVSSADVKRARIEWQNQQKVTREEKESLDRLADKKRIERHSLEENLKLLEDKLEAQKEQGKSSEVLGAQILNKEYQLRVLGREVDLIDIRVELALIDESEKELAFEALDIRYRLHSDEVGLSKHIVELERWRDRLESALQLIEMNRSNAVRAIEHRNIKSSELRKKIIELKEGKQSVSGDTIYLLEMVKDAQKESQLDGEYLSILSALDTKEKSLLRQVNLLISEFSSKQREVNVWRRSSHAISFTDAVDSIHAAELFLLKLFWDTPSHISPLGLVAKVKQINWNWLWGLFCYALLFGISFLGVRRLFKEICRRLNHMTSVQHSKMGLLYLLLISGTISFIYEYFAVIYSWFFIHISIAGPISLLGFSFASIPAFYKAVFYLASIPLFFAFTARFMVNISSFNQRLSYFFFPEHAQKKATRLLASILYTGAVILPLRAAFIHYGPTGSRLPSVFFAAYSLVILVVLLLFFNREDVLSLIPRNWGGTVDWFREKVEKYYYPAFGFVMGLLIISNPYIGYSNLAWFLAFAIPSSIIFILGMLRLHQYLREYSLFLFIKEDDGNAIDQFDHAKMLYSFFIILTFLGFVFSAVIVLSRIWGFSYTAPQLWHALSEEWVFSLGDKERFGVVQVFMFSTFIAVGYLVSSLINNYFLDQLFDVFRIDEGAQNTFLRITQYTTILFFTVLGFVAVNLSQYVMPVLGLLVVGIGFGLREQVADVFAGILILLERRIEIGHFMEIGDVMGTVHTIAIRSTIIRTARNFFISVPNRDLISKPVINWGAGRLAVGVQVNLEVAYGSDPKVVMALIREVANSHPLVLRVPVPVIRLDACRESDLQFFVRAFISPRKVRDNWDVASDIRIGLLKACRDNGIQIPLPQTVVFLKNKEEDPTDISDEHVNNEFRKDDDLGAISNETKDIVTK